MIRVVITDQAGKTVSPAELTSASDLRDAVEQARKIIRECENVAQLKMPSRPNGSGVVPYLN